MRGTGSAFSRLPAARAIIAGAAFLAGTLGSAAHGQDTTETVAFFAPRLSLSGAALPQPLTPSDAARLRRVFALQAQGDMPAAIAETAQVRSPLLLGDVLADRYLGGKTTPTMQELSDWLARFGDLPDAPAIYAALVARLPPGATAPPPPQAADPAPPPPPGQKPAFMRNPALDRSVAVPAQAGRFDQALRLIAHTRGLHALYGATLRAEVARQAFWQNDDALALQIAETATREAAGRVGSAAFTGGLAAWRLGRIHRARRLFETAARAELATPAERSRAAFWAARAQLRLHDRGGYALWLKRAAEQPRSFYGLLARRILGEPQRPPPLAQDVLGDADVAAIGALPAGKRAFALLQIGQTGRAAIALRSLWDTTRDRPGLSRALILVARAAHLDSLAAELTDLLPDDDTLPRPASLPRLRPIGGFRTDPALVYALARLESNFNAAAISPAGARGLMQLMPQTAGYIAGGHATPGSIARRLHDPALNLELGQRYMAYLAGVGSVHGSLIKLLAAYNSGPGSFEHWAGTIQDENDPLLFIESIPIRETRHYVRRALAYTWRYAALMHLPSPSLDTLAAGRWPRFSAPAKRPLPPPLLH